MKLPLESAKVSEDRQGPCIEYLDSCAGRVTGVTQRDSFSEEVGNNQIVLRSTFVISHFVLSERSLDLSKKFDYVGTNFVSENNITTKGTNYFLFEEPRLLVQKLRGGVSRTPKSRLSTSFSDRT